jgi:hypothetical protein
VKDWFLGAIGKPAIKAVLSPFTSMVGGAVGGTGVIGDLLKGLVPKLVNGLIDKLVSEDTKAGASMGGGVIPTGQHMAIIKAAMAAAHVPPPGSAGAWLTGMNTLITRESNWNAGAKNNWDSNAKAGMASQGLAQTIPPTFNAYVPASLRSLGILNPIANVAAAIRYIVARYGNITNVQQANASRPPAGYWHGGTMSPGWSIVGEKGPEAVYAKGGESVTANNNLGNLFSGQGGGNLGTVEVVIKTEDGKEIERKLVSLKQSRGGRRMGWESK